MEKYYIFEDCSTHYKNKIYVYKVKNWREERKTWVIWSWRTSHGASISDWQEGTFLWC